jgi:hypothetical protein
MSKQAKGRPLITVISFGEAYRKDHTLGGMVQDWRVVSRLMRFMS